MRKILHTSILLLIALSHSFIISAQDKRAQYPGALANSYVSVNIGYINYHFSRKQLEPGYTTSAIRIPHAAVGVLFGHRFNDYLSAEISYMRPVSFVEYENVNGNQTDYEVGMNVAGLSVRGSLPIANKIRINAEAGISVVTRGGFIVIDATGVRDIAFANVLLGGGIQYQLNRKWELLLNAALSPAHEKERQPATVFYSAGFNYIMRPLSKEKVERAASSGYIFPKQMIQAGFTSNVLGYGVNDFVSKGVIPIFWSGAAQVKQGLSINYQRNIFHTRKVFSLDWGAEASYWKTRKNNENIYTISFYPVARFTILRGKQTDLYLNYSVAGPSFISKTVIEGKNTGKKFTFQDFMGVGLFLGKTKTFNAEIRISHFSNGNIFPQNNGVMVPLTLNLGYCFN